MKKSILLIIFLLSLNSIIAQEKLSKDELAVQQLIKDIFEDIWSDFKTDKVLTHHTEDFLLLEQGEIWTNETIFAYQNRKIKEASKAVRNNRFEFIRTEQRGKNMIWIAYHNFAKWTLEGKITRESQYLESAVAVKTKGKWKLQELHSTRVKNVLTP